MFPLFEMRSSVFDYISSSLPCGKESLNLYLRGKFLLNILCFITECWKRGFGERLWRVNVSLRIHKDSTRQMNFSFTKAASNSENNCALNLLHDRNRNIKIKVCPDLKRISLRNITYSVGGQGKVAYPLEFFSNIVWSDVSREFCCESF